MIEQVFSERLLAQGDDQGVISVRQNTRGEVLWSSQGHPDGHRQAITALAWSPDGEYLVSGSADAVIKVWDTATGTVLQTYTGHAAEVRALAWLPECSRIVSSGDLESLYLWTPSLSSQDYGYDDEIQKLGVQSLRLTEIRDRELVETLRAGCARRELRGIQAEERERGDWLSCQALERRGR